MSDHALTLAARPRWLLALLLLCLPSAGLWAQGPPPPGDEPPPGSIREAYERAERFGEEPTPGQTPAPTEAHSPWYDGVHYVGIGGALGLLAAAGVGLWIFLVVAFRKDSKRILVRRLWRRRHYALGLSAGALALAHVVGRTIQEGELSLGPASRTSLAFLLLVLSGVIRAWPPRPVARYPWLWIWLHRVLLVLAVVLLYRHVMWQYLKFTGGG